MRYIKKIIWYLSGLWVHLTQPISNASIPFVGLTGTDGKTTTAHYLYEIAKAYGFNPVLISTTGVKFNDSYQPIKFKTNSLLAQKVKKCLKKIKDLDFLGLLNICFSKQVLDDNDNIDYHRTTPLASDIRKILNTYIHQHKANFVILEVTSHALDQYRIFGIKFDSVGFTNITNEHLDYHGTWNNYANAKVKLTHHLKKGGLVAVNKDDVKSYNFITNRTNPCKLINYSKGHFNYTKNTFRIDYNDREFKASPIKLDETQDSINSIVFNLQLFGQYNISNALCAISIFAGYLTRSNKDFRNQINAYLNKIQSPVSFLSDIPGRSQKISENPTIIVDFAHTSNGFKQLFESLKSSVEDKKIISVFGSAGERDPSSRFDKGKFAAESSRIILLCPEDPRTEKVSEINKAILKGIKSVKRNIKLFEPQDQMIEITNYIKTNPDHLIVILHNENKPKARAKAIKFGICIADDFDTVLILGKGPEKTLSFDGKEHEWSDEKCVKEALKIRNANQK